MFSALRNRFGIPGVISVVALVFAMFGGAYAASNGSSDSSNATASAKKKKKKAKSKRGPRGPRGRRGPRGATGPAGPAGPQGPQGQPGARGANGANGADGVSVTSTALAEGDENCVFGGAEFSAANGTTYACNGEPGEPGTPGEPGEPGEPWTPDNSLPSGAMETGTYALTSETGNGQVFGEFLLEAISFPVPLAAPLEPEKVIMVEDGEAPPGSCENPEHAGAAGVENPEAAPGFLCVYEGGFTLGMTFVGIATPGGFGPGAGATGAVIAFTPAETGERYTMGTWAVTAP